MFRARNSSGKGGRVFATGTPPPPSARVSTEPGRTQNQEQRFRRSSEGPKGSLGVSARAGTGSLQMNVGRLAFLHTDRPALGPRSFEDLQTNQPGGNAGVRAEVIGRVNACAVRLMQAHSHRAGAHHTDRATLAQPDNLRRLLSASDLRKNV